MTTKSASRVDIADADQMVEEALASVKIVFFGGSSPSAARGMRLGVGCWFPLFAKQRD
jgi:hypothetical protein